MTAFYKAPIVIAGLAEGLTLLDLAKELERDNETLISFVEKKAHCHAQ